MKILFFSSGYTGIYHFFEKWIIFELTQGHEVKVFNPRSGLASLKANIRSFHPDVAIVFLGFKVPVNFLEWLKGQGIKIAVWFTEDPYYMDRTTLLVGHYDFIFTIDIAAKEFYLEKGHNQTFHLPLASEPKVFKPLETGPAEKSDLCMVGYPYPERVKMITSILEKTNYKIKLIGKWKKSIILNRYLNHPNLSIHDVWVEPPQVARYYNGASIVLNTHRPMHLKQNKNSLGIAGKSINNRTFDVALCGAFQLIDYKEDLPLHFTEGKEIVSFKDNEDLLNKMDYFMENEKERKQIAENGRKRVLREHTFEHRINTMLGCINSSNQEGEDSI